MSDSYDKNALDEKQQHPSVEIEQFSSNLGDQPMSKKKALSPYFTIAAAAFGLISDGCRFIFNYLKYKFDLFQRRNLLDQNNLMTMANVVTASVLAIRWISLFDLHRSFLGSYLYPTTYTADISTRVSNSLLVGNAAVSTLNNCGS